MRNLLVFQTAYSYKELVERKLLNFATSKSLDNFFEFALFVNVSSCISLAPDCRKRYGKVSLIKGENNSFYVDAPMGRFFMLRKFEFLNFMLVQINLFLVIRKFVSKFGKFSIVRGEDPRLNGLLAIGYAKYFDLPSVIGVWGNPERIRMNSGLVLNPKVFRKPSSEYAFEKFVLRICSAVLTQNNENREYVVNCGVSEKKIFQFRLGNALEKIHFVEPSKRKTGSLLALKREREVFLIGTVSRLEKIKMVDHVLQIFSESKFVNESLLVIFGDGRELDNLKIQAHSLGISDRILFLGNVDQEVLASELCALDLVICPLMGRALSEVGLASLPVVAYNIDCHPEVIVDGESGFLVTAGDFSQTIIKCDLLLENRVLARKLGANLRHFLLSYMSPDLLVEEQRRIIRNILQQYHSG